MSKLQRRQRRDVHFECNEDIFADIENLKARGWETTGDWTLGQIVMHLALGMEEVYEGLDFGPPWFVRKIIGPFFKSRFTKGPMFSGYNIPNKKSKILPGSDAQIGEAVARLRRGCERLEHEAPMHPHPFVGKLTHEEWKMMTLRHAELHLSFAHPKD